jgi:4-carboxymuconolactone decarboxylase
VAELDEKGQRGVDFIAGIMGEQYGNAFREAATSSRFGSPITRMAASHAFADAWGHPGLERKEKSLVVIAALIALRQTAELRNHIKIGAANGLTVAEMEGILVQLTPYLGLPAIATATTAVIEALREIGMDPDVPTSEERGLL